MCAFPSLIAFGSLGTWSLAGELSELRKSLHRHENLEPVRNAISRLPELWETLVSQDASLKTLPGRAAAGRLAAWVLSEDATISDSAQNNALRLPLTIVSHLCDYLDYLQQNGFSSSALLAHIRQTAGIHGFCAGLLSALTVSKSDEEEKVGFYGALSVYLAFGIGVYVDLDALNHGQTKCLAVRWRSPRHIASVEDVLKEHDGVRSK